MGSSWIFLKAHNSHFPNLVWKPGELKSLTASNVPCIILTATASLSTKRDIFRALNLNQSSSFIMEHSPERPNVQFSVRYLDKNLPVSSVFSTLIDDLRSKNVSCERTMIFCQTRKQCALVYSAFKESLGVDFYVNNPGENLSRIFKDPSGSSRGSL